MGDAIFLGCGLRIVIGSHRRVSFFGDLPISCAAKEVIEFGPRGKPRSRDALRDVIIWRVYAARSDEQGIIGPVLLIEFLTEDRLAGIDPIGIAANRHHIANRDRVFRETQRSEDGSCSSFDFRQSRGSIGIFYLKRHIDMRVPEFIFRDSAGDLHVFLSVVRGGTVVSECGTAEGQAQQAK